MSPTILAIMILLADWLALARSYLCGRAWLRTVLQGSGFWCQGPECSAQRSELGLRFPGSGFRVQGVGLGVQADQKVFDPVQGSELRAKI